MGLTGHHIGVIASSKQVSAGIWTNLDHWWKMTETSGDVLDSHGTLDGEAMGGAIQTTGGIVLDGVSDWISMLISAEDGPFGTDDFTIITRINPTVGWANRAILGGSINGLKIDHDASYGLRATKEGGAASSVTSLTMSTGTVQMIALVRSGTTFRFFIEGSFESETLSADFTGATLYIGLAATGATEFAGTIRDFAIFNDAKSDAYISAFYNSGSYTDYEDGDPI